MSGPSRIHSDQQTTIRELLLGRTVVTAQRKTFEDYRSMEWWCSTADGIPELGLFK